ncbi:MAG: PQQ-binding-like beta-propeller repeat protein, partial [Pirellulaceae bacterium]|nr:PQQ-binding-like beta-propeller repeat protein [Pirellulaceae bacterium]
CGGRAPGYEGQSQIIRWKSRDSPTRDGWLLAWYAGSLDRITIHWARVGQALDKTIEKDHRMKCSFDHILFILIGVAIVSSGSRVDAEGWPQFRGVNASGVSRESIPLPADIGPDRHVVWKLPVGRGHSSPVVLDERVYLTSLRDKQLLTLAIDVASGKIAWTAEAEYQKLESVHRIGSPATASCATDGDIVISFFGSSGLHAYSVDGELLWKQPMGPFDNSSGAAGSPIIVDDLVVIIEDHDTGSFLAAYDKRNGQQLWRIERSEFRRNYSTPIVWQHADGKQIVVAGTGQVTAYDSATGRHVWSVRRSSRVVSATPVIGDDGQLYVVNSGGGEAPDQPSFAQLLATADDNKNRLMEQDELPKSIIRSFMDQFDRDKNGSLDEPEYETIRATMAYAKPVAMAVKSGGHGDITETHIAWSATRSLPRNASSLVVNGLVFMIKDGGVLTVLAADSGRQLNSGRLRATGKFFSSPIYGDGKIYALSDQGKLNVITAEANWKQLAIAEFGEDVYATPAIANGRIYIRTVAHLYCFAGDD